MTDLDEVELKIIEVLTANDPMSSKALFDQVGICDERSDFFVTLNRLKARGLIKKYGNGYYALGDKKVVMPAINNRPERKVLPPVPDLPPAPVKVRDKLAELGAPVSPHKDIFMHDIGEPDGITINYTDEIAPFVEASYKDMLLRSGNRAGKSDLTISNNTSSCIKTVTDRKPNPTEREIVLEPDVSESALPDLASVQKAVDKLRARVEPRKVENIEVKLATLDMISRIMDPTISAVLDEVVKDYETYLAPGV